MSNNAGVTAIRLYAALVIGLLLLKLFGITELSWAWALSPLWVPMGIIVILLLIACSFDWDHSGEEEAMSRAHRERWQNRDANSTDAAKN